MFLLEDLTLTSSPLPVWWCKTPFCDFSQGSRIHLTEVLDWNHAKHFQPISTPVKLVFYYCLGTIAVTALLLDSSWGWWQASCSLPQPPLESRRVQQWYKIQPYSSLIAAGILQLWSHTMRNTFRAAIHWACFSGQQICLVSWREMSSIDLILLFFLFFSWLQSPFCCLSLVIFSAQA